MPARDESLTFLAVPERLVVAQTDEYARHLAQARPSTFPHFTAARDYWGAVNTACGVTTQEYAFNAGQQITLGILGAGHTAEQVLKGVYEGTIGRFTEWLFSTDTPEDRFAADTVARAGPLRARRAVAAVPVRRAAAAAVGGRRRCGGRTSSASGSAAPCSASSTASRRCARPPPGWWPRRRRTRTRPVCTPGSAARRPPCCRPTAPRSSRRSGPDRSSSRCRAATPSPAASSA